ncbi:MAG: M67 family metallopeptidase [Candidatus Omnitrophota bacterium]|nr:M67 family metallopeptidase [Candidatus Omnitrophota bacterium]
MIFIKKNLVEKIIAHSRKEFPNEACGILVGKDGKAEKVYEMANVDKSPSSYLMEPKEQLKIMKEIRNSELEMVGIYHSHVASEAYPSSHDVELAFYPEASYVIISLKDKRNPRIRSFKIVDGRITEEEVKIE